MPTPVRRRPAPLRATVLRVTALTPHLVRVTVTGDDFARFQWPGPAAHLKVILPEPGADDVALPEPDADGLVAFDRAAPVTMRTYTARRYDPTAGELDIDFLLHGDGPASNWAARARPGDHVAVTVPRAAGFTEAPDADWVLVAGDASALPAIATIAPTLTRPATILVELADPADRLDVGHPVEWLAAGELERAIATVPRPGGRGQVWAAAEAGVVRGVRRRLVDEFGRDRLTTRGYWRVGASNHPDHDYGEDEEAPRGRPGAGTGRR
jgi:NADPH-dependent ferric siderophore reductase